MMRRFFISLIVGLFAVPVLAQELDMEERKKMDVEKAQITKGAAKGIKCEVNSDCPKNQVCDQVKRLCVQKAMSMVELETAELTKQVEEMEAKKADIRRGTIKKMEDLLNGTGYSNRAEIYHRLAEAYWEETHYQYLKARKVWDEAMEKYDEGVPGAVKPEEPTEDYSMALEYYRRILREYQDYARIDEVLYYLGRGALDAGRATKDIQLQREGEKYLKSLEQTHPNSRFIPKALLDLGEYYFENSQVTYAQIYYEKIVNNYPTSPMYNYAVYKLAWVYYNTQNFDKAIERFQAVVDAMKRDTGKAKLDFRDQALNDMILCYVEIPEGWQTALKYYTGEIGEEGAYQKLHVMGELYVAQGKNSEAIDLYRHFIEKWPLSPRIPEYFQTLLDIANTMADWAFIERVINEIADYFKFEGPWVLANKEKNTEAVDTAMKMTEETIFFVANHYHVAGDKLEAKGDKAGAEPNYAKAADYYAEYLRRFPNSPRSYEINFWYAEILYFNLQDYRKASEQYKLVIEKDKKGEFLENAALGVIYCQEELMAQAGLRERATKGDVQVQKERVSADAMTNEMKEIPETPLDPLEEDYIKAADKYTELLLEARKDPEFRKKYPNRGEMIPNIMYIAAEVFYRHGKFNEAVLRFENIFKYDPKNKFAAIAATMIMDCYIRVNNCEEVEKWARKLIAEKNFTFKNREELEMIIANAILLHARDLEMEGKTTAAIDELKRLNVEFKNNKDILAHTTYTLGYLYIRSKKLREAIEKYEELVKTYPKSEQAPQAQHVIGQIYEAQTQFDKAAEAYMAMQKFKDYPDTPRDLYQASTLYSALKQWDKAIKALQTFLNLYPKHEWASRAYMRIGDIEKERGNLQSAYKQYIETGKKFKDQPIIALEALAKAAQVLHDIDKVKNRKQVLTHCQTALKIFEKMTEEQKKKARQWAGQAAFYTAQYSYYDFSVFQIDTGNYYRLSATLEKKAKLLLDAELLYEAVIKIGSKAWSAAAYYQIGLLYDEFAETLYACPLPDGLTEDEVDMYRAELEQNGAEPAKEKARASFRVAIQMAHKLGVYSEWSWKSGTMAAKLATEDFPVGSEPLVGTTKPKDTLESTSFIRGLRRGDVEVDFVTIETKQSGSGATGDDDDEEDKTPGNEPGEKKPEGGKPADPATNK